MQETVKLKTEAAKNLQKQIESLKRRHQLDLESQTVKFEKQFSASRCRIDELLMDVAQKDMMISELKQQLDQMVNSRTIDINYIVTKTANHQTELNQIKKSGSALKSIFKVDD